MTASEVVTILQRIQARKKPVALDCEGGCGLGPACVGFAISATVAVVVPFYGVAGVSIWSEEDEIIIWTAVADLLEDPSVPKIIQNASYENFLLAWCVGIVIHGLADDTMLKHFELYAELDKSLEFQASIYTNQPYWKLEHKVVEGRYVPFRNGKRVTSEEWFIYNGTDCCVTYEVNEAMEARLKPKQQEHYRWNVGLLVPVAYMSLRGLRYDAKEAKRRLEQVQEEIYELQDEINREAATSPSRTNLQHFYAALERPIRSEGVGGTEGAVAALEGCNTAVANPATVASHTGGEEGDFATEGSQGVATLQGGVEACASTYGDSVGGRKRDVAAMGRSGVAALLPLLTEAFCQARRAEAREVEEVSWQPMRWVAGKKKRVAKMDASPAGGVEGGSQLPAAGAGRWVKAGKRLAQPPEAHECPEATACCEEAPDPAIYQRWFKPHRKLVTRNVPVEVETLEDVRRFVRGRCVDECKRAIRLCEHISKGGAGAARRGELATLLGIHCKVGATNAGGDAQWYLYDHLGLPRQFQKEGNRLTDRLASDDEAIIKAYLKSGRDEASRDARALTFLKMRRLVTQTKFLQATPDEDGRIRSSMNLVATPTCRMAMYGSPTGSSDLNLQTIGKGLRSLFKADEGCWLGQRDLGGADGWTVAAFTAMLGDPNMLEDYKARLKPAQILTVMQDRGEAVNRMSREELRPLCKVITEETDWRYFANKRRQHGRSYGMGKNTTSDQILTDSFKLLGRPIYVSPGDCEVFFRTCFDVRYPGVQRWHEWMGRLLREKGVLVASTGFQRQVFGRKDEHGTLKECLAHFPQYFTTYAIKNTVLAMDGSPRQWTDPENRREDGGLRVEPLLFVHDSNVSQWREEDTAFARRKLAEWFENPIEVAGLRLVIPASGTFGATWKDQEFTL
jgi:hypothetical protein